MLYEDQIEVLLADGSTALVRGKSMPPMKETVHPPQVLMVGGEAATTKGPAFHLIPRVALEELAARFELGEERKGDKAWNAGTDNQQILTDKPFILERISHVIHHALKLRDQIVNKNTTDITDDMIGNASAVAWGGIFLISVAKELESKV